MKDPRQMLMKRSLKEQYKELKKKSSFFEKINKIGKPLANLTKKKEGEEPKLEDPKW
jgi:hypothetical protein